MRERKEGAGEVSRAACEIMETWNQAGLRDAFNERISDLTNPDFAPTFRPSHVVFRRPRMYGTQSENDAQKRR